MSKRKPTLPPEFVEGLVQMANNNADAMKERRNANGDLDSVREMLATCDLVYGVWQDANAPYGVDCLIIKGDPALHSVIDSGRSADLRMTALRCRNAEEAEAFRQVMGDVKRQH